MEFGSIKIIDSVKRFGFITSTTGEDIFFLFSDVPKANWPDLIVGQMVKFNVYSGAKRIQAIDIELV